MIPPSEQDFFYFAQIVLFFQAKKQARKFGIFKGEKELTSLFFFYNLLSSKEVYGISDILYSGCYLTFLRLTSFHMNFDLKIY
jgi:hypothetical protein